MIYLTLQIVCCANVCEEKKERRGQGQFVRLN